MQLLFSLSPPPPSPPRSSSPEPSSHRLITPRPALALAPKRPLPSVPSSIPNGSSTLGPSSSPNLTIDLTEASSHTPIGVRPCPRLLFPPSFPTFPTPPPVYLSPGAALKGGGDDSGDGEGDADEDSDFFSAEELVVRAGGGPRRRVDVGANASRVPEQMQRQDSEDQCKDQHAAHELRRWHALMEVVHSEVNYVRDLRVLVHVYLSLLPTLPLSSPAQNTVHSLSGDAAQLLSLHERFARALQAASAHVACGGRGAGMDSAVMQLAELFIDEAATFDVYQRFCATQPDVLRLLQPAQARAEWAAYERRCATGDLEPFSIKASEQEREREREMEMEKETEIPVQSQNPLANAPARVSLMPSAFKSPPRHRCHSYDSLAGVFSSNTMRHRPSFVARPLSDNTHTHSSSLSFSHTHARLRFHDFLIKPVQRICKYPLMLEGLRSKGKGGDSEADKTVARAVECMRSVAMRVDEARMKRESVVKSQMIVDRMEPHAVVTREFLRSLGDCLLAGSLDVVHHHHAANPITSPVRVKYLGGFLYVGGYLLLVKVGRGRTYRVKHWFPLALFEIVDIPQDTALVPSSFRLSYMDHHFEIAAACPREKDLWLRAINEARGVPRPWASEPISSLQTLHAESPPSSATSVTPPATDFDPPDAPASPLKRGGSSSSTSESNLPLARSMLRLPFRPVTTPTPVPPPPVRYIFSHATEPALLLHRSSNRHRAFVDRGLTDVLSDFVISLRRQAQSPLFPPPPRAVRKRLMRRGSVLVRATGEEEQTLRSKATSRRMAIFGVLYTEPENIKPNAGVLNFPKPEESAASAPFAEGSHAQLPASPIIRSNTVAGRENQSDRPHYHRRTRSLVGSMKGLMRFSSMRPSETVDAWSVLCAPSGGTDIPSATTFPAVKGRRRVSSAPASPPLSPTDSVYFRDHPDPGLSPASSTTPATLFPPPSILDPTSPLPPAFPATANSTSKIFRKKSAPMTAPTQAQTLKPKRSFKNFVFYSRLTSPT